MYVQTEETIDPADPQNKTTEASSWNKSLEEIDIDSSELKTDNILNIKGDTNSVLWEENITSFLLTKDYLQITEDVVLPMDLW